MKTKNNSTKRKGKKAASRIDNTVTSARELKTASKNNSAIKKGSAKKKKSVLKKRSGIKGEIGSSKSSVKKDNVRKIFFRVLSGIFRIHRRNISEIEKKAEIEKKKGDQKSAAEDKKRGNKHARDRLKQIKKKEKVRRRGYTKKALQQNIIKAGMSATPEQVHRGAMMYSGIMAFAALMILSVYLSKNGLLNTRYFLILLLSFATLGWALLYGLSWLLYHEILDYKIYQRKKEVEEVLADFLLLTSANVRAGMTIDKALWHAVRPRFGVLAKEIEKVAKKTLSGENLQVALDEFGESYDSSLLKRSVSLLIEGIEAGGEIGELLNNIALDIQETNLMRKEMSSSVATYAIFIGFASSLAAPFLFALAGQVLKVVTRIGNKIDVSPQTLANSGGFQFSFSGGGAIKYSNFLIFAVTTLVMTSIISQIIVATIRKGNAEEALMNIPIAIGVALTLFFVIGHFLGMFLGGLIT